MIYLYRKVPFVPKNTKSTKIWLKPRDSMGWWLILTFWACRLHETRMHNVRSSSCFKFMFKNTNYVEYIKIPKMEKNSKITKKWLIEFISYHFSLSYANFLLVTFLDTTGPYRCQQFWKSHICQNKCHRVNGIKIW